MGAVFHFYVDPDKAGVDPKNVDQNATFPARHTMVRDGFDKPTGDVVGDCALPPAPSPPLDKNSFIDDCTRVAEQQQKANSCICPPAAASGAPCPPSDKQTVCENLNDVDLAGAILKRVYGGEALKNERVTVQESEVLAFDQRDVFSEFSTEPYKPFNAWQNASMAREGYVFIPKACREGRPCKLHVAFHGCLQGGETDRRPAIPAICSPSLRVTTSGRQANDIIVLYPQVIARNTRPDQSSGLLGLVGAELHPRGLPHEARQADQGRGADDQHTGGRSEAAGRTARATLMRKGRGARRRMPNDDRTGRRRLNRSANLEHRIMAKPIQPMQDWGKTLASLDLTKGSEELLNTLAGLNVPGVDMDALVASQRDNLEALGAANRAALEGAKAVGEWQAKILQETMQALTAAMSARAKVGTPQQMVATETELAKKAFETAVQIDAGARRDRYPGESEGCRRDHQAHPRESGRDQGRAEDRYVFFGFPKGMSRDEAGPVSRRPMSSA